MLAEAGALTGISLCPTGRGFVDFRRIRAMRLAAAFIFLSAVAWSPLGWPGDRNCTEAERAKANKWLFLNARDQKASLEKHLPWGAPKRLGASDPETLLVHSNYVIQYDDNLRIPLWVAYRLDARGLNRTPDRVNCFRQDPRINSPKASLPNDYDEPDFDQGHLAPSEDMSHSLNQNVNSFIMSNMAPQYGTFNRGIWKRLEGQARAWTKPRKTLYVISGSVLDHDKDGKPDPASAAKRMKARNGSRRVAIPSHFYKILVYKCRDGSIETLAFLLPHDKASHTGAAGQKYLESHVTSIAKIEAMSGLEFFPALAASRSIDWTLANAFWRLKPACDG